LNYPRRQQYQRLSRAGRAAPGSATAALLGLVAGSAGAAPLAGLLLLIAVGLGLYARHWLLLAGRSRVGARSEDQVQRALAPLRAEGWGPRHSLPWRGRGDIDSVAIAPTGVAVAIETKARTYDERHLARVREEAVWLSRRRRRWCRHGALAVLCLVRAREVEHRQHGSSSFSAGEIVEAQWAARERHRERFRTEEPPYSILVRGIELDVLPTARRHGMGILTYSPLAGGRLSGSWSADSSPTSPARQRLAARFDMSLPENQRKLEAVQQLAMVANEAGVSLIELAIAFASSSTTPP
jgi:Aldo/keto reductase family/Nuclease-related domain